MSDVVDFEQRKNKRKQVEKKDGNYSSEENMHEEIYVCNCGSDIFLLYVNGKIECAMCNIFIESDDQLTP